MHFRVSCLAFLLYQWWLGGQIKILILMMSCLTFDINILQLKTGNVSKSALQLTPPI